MPASPTSTKSGASPDELRLVVNFSADKIELDRLKDAEFARLCAKLVE
jgi:hypothetical protein